MYLYIYMEEKRLCYMEKKEKIEIHSLKDLDLLEPDERLKYEIANEIGLFDKVVENGWKSLSSKESGRIGGLLSNRKKKNNAPIQKNI